MITNVTNNQDVDVRERRERDSVFPRLTGDHDLRIYRPAPVASSIARLEEVERHLALLRAPRISGGS
jgi:hypothetical protein